MFFGAVLSPILVVLLLNTFMLLTVTVVLMKNSRSQKGNVDKSKDKSNISMFVVLLVHMIIFGVAWAFAGLTVTNAAPILLFQIIFALTDALQGLFLLFFFCVSSNMFQLWKQFIFRGMYNLPQISSQHYGIPYRISRKQPRSHYPPPLSSHHCSTSPSEPPTRVLDGN